MMNMTYCSDFISYSCSWRFTPILSAAYWHKVNQRIEKIGLSQLTVSRALAALVDEVVRVGVGHLFNTRYLISVGTRLDCT